MYIRSAGLHWHQLAHFIRRCILGIFLIFVLISTAFHFHHVRSKRKNVAYSVEAARESHSKDGVEVLYSFSIINNVKKMFSYHPNELNLECVSGVKFISMTCIISSHSLLFLIGGPVLNTEFYDKVIADGELVMLSLLSGMLPRGSKQGFFYLFIDLFMRFQEFKSKITTTRYLIKQPNQQRKML